MLTTNPMLDIPQALLRALFRQPQALLQALEDAGLAPHEIAMWARQAGMSPEIEKQAGWLSVGQRPDHYKPLLEVASSTLRAGEPMEALPLFRWAYRLWRNGENTDPRHSFDGVKLFALWGECLFHLQEVEKARQCWLHAIKLVQDELTLAQLARVIERCGAQDECRQVLEQARLLGLPGAASLWERQQRLWTTCSETTKIDSPPVQSSPDAPEVVVLADTANLDMVCQEQYGYHCRLDYARLLQVAAQHGPIHVKMAFVPNVPETIPTREHLNEVGFVVDLVQPKRSHGRVVANADTAMAAFAVRWAGDPKVGRLELWSGDGDFVRVRDLVCQTWPHVSVVFRSFEAGTAASIRCLGQDWEAIGAQFLQAESCSSGCLPFRYRR